MLFQINFSYAGRCRLAGRLVKVNILTAIGGLLINLWGFAVARDVQLFTLLDGSEYSQYTLPTLLWVIGVLVCVNAIAGCIVFYEFSLERKKGLILMSLYLLAAALFSITLAVAALVAQFHTNYVSESFERGFIVAMRKFKKDLKIKILIEELQMDFKCCGSVNLKDWFKVSWVDTNYINMGSPAVNMVNGEAFLKSVPFSCCDPTRTIAPCRHDNLVPKVLGNAKLYEEGCTTAIIHEVQKNTLRPLAITIGIVFVIQTIATVMARYLRTSAGIARKDGDDEDDAPGYLIKFGRGLKYKDDVEKGDDGEKVTRKRKRKEDEGEEDDEEALLERKEARREKRKNKEQKEMERTDRERERKDERRQEKRDKREQREDQEQERKERDMDKKDERKQEKREKKDQREEKEQKRKDKERDRKDERKQDKRDKKDQREGQQQQLKEDRKKEAKNKEGKKLKKKSKETQKGQKKGKVKGAQKTVKSKEVPKGPKAPKAPKGAKGAKGHKMKVAGTKSKKGGKTAGKIKGGKKKGFKK